MVGQIYKAILAVGMKHAGSFINAQKSIFTPIITKVMTFKSDPVKVVLVFIKKFIKSKL